MRGPLLIAVAQPPCVPYDVAANAVRHAELVRAARARVVVFPELSLTGYELDAPAVDPQDPGLAPLIAACAQTGTLALVGAPVRDGDGREYIATVSVTGEGTAVVYRKMFLHPPEDQRFAPGERPVVIDVDGWRLGLAICRDTGVAEHAAATADMGMVPRPLVAGRVGHHLHPPASEDPRMGLVRAAASYLVLVYLVLVCLVLLTRLIPPVRDALFDVELSWTCPVSSPAASARSTIRPCCWPPGSWPVR